MANFDYFAFVNARKHSIAPTEEDLKEFNLYMTQMVLSMDIRFIDVLNKMNTKEFFSLPKNIQCMAFTSFDGVNIDTSWKKSKASTKAGHIELIDKIMKVYNMSHNEAESCVKFRTIDIAELEDLYTRIYEPETIKFKAPKKIIKKVSKK